MRLSLAEYGTRARRVRHGQVATYARFCCIICFAPFLESCRKGRQKKFCSVFLPLLSPPSLCSAHMVRIWYFILPLRFCVSGAAPLLLGTRRFKA